MYDESRGNGTSFLGLVTIVIAGLVTLSACSGDLRRDGVDPTVAQAPAAESTGNCGNGTLDAGENCESCPADCAVPGCTEIGEKLSFDIRLTVPFGEEPTSITTLVTYDGKLMRYPGSGLTAEAQKAITNRPKGVSTFANAFGQAVRVVQTNNAGLPAGGIYSVVLDRCKDARDAEASDLSCKVEGCAGKFGLIDDCSCAVARSDAVDVSKRESTEGRRDP